MTDPAFDMFHSPHYLAHNRARLEHLESLGLPLNNRQVLEPGAGIGDHTLFHLARGSHVTACEPRPENCAAFRVHMKEAAPAAAERWTLIEGDVFDAAALESAFDIVHCYGLLYHLSRPAEALAALAPRCRGLLLLETCVSFGEDAEENLVHEPGHDLSQAIEGQGCRPTRPWVMNALQNLFPHVYCTLTQPNHGEFPLDWTRPDLHAAPLARAVFVASRQPLSLPSLSETLPALQGRTGA